MPGSDTLLPAPVILEILFHTQKAQPIPRLSSQDTCSALVRLSAGGEALWHRPGARFPSGAGFGLNATPLGSIEKRVIINQSR